MRQTITAAMFLMFSGLGAMAEAMAVATTEATVAGVALPAYSFSGHEV
ncbi:MAG TPA: hypothetical protein VEX43_16270 [Chthoniobacterales bacterium]|nr:hypothetical protein [Chthoniobacterales bacterium]